MKTICSSLAFLLCVLSLQAAPKDYAKLSEALFSEKKGAWEDAKNWKGNAVPGENAFAVLRNSCAVSISQKVPDIASLHIGSTGEAPVLTIEKGGALKARDVRVWRNVKGAGAELVIDGGEVEADLMSIGACRTLSSTGIVNVNSGKLSGRIYVGSDLPNTGTGTLSLNGSDASVEPSKERGQLLLQTSGTLCFNLDEKGVGSVNFERAPVVLGSGSKIIVNGKNYRGGKKTIPLIIHSSIRDEGASLRAEEFPSGLTALIQKKPGRILLRIDKAEK